MSLIIKLDKGISIDTNLKDKLKNIVSLIFYDEGKGDNEINLRILDDNKMKKFTVPSSDIVAASDAFFPFVDGIEKLIQSGVKAVVQPSGSINDKEIIKFANQTNTVLVFSKTRHFRH